MPSEPSTIQITNAGVLAAMAHPLRRRILDILQVDGPSTASTLAAQTDQAVGNISHHLRVLGNCGLIEEAPELARDRRERWWRRCSQSLRWNSGDFDEDPATQAIAAAAASLNLEHHVDVVRRWAAAPEERRRQWRDGSYVTDHWLTLTPAELAELSAEVLALHRRWADRPIPEDGQARETVFTFAVGVPGRP